MSAIFHQGKNDENWATLNHLPMAHQTSLLAEQAGPQTLVQWYNLSRRHTATVVSLEISCQETSHSSRPLGPAAAEAPETCRKMARNPPKNDTFWAIPITTALVKPAPRTPAREWLGAKGGEISQAS